MTDDLETESPCDDAELRAAGIRPLGSATRLGLFVLTLAAIVFSHFVWLVLAAFYVVTIGRYLR